VRLVTVLLTFTRSFVSRCLLRRKTFSDIDVDFVSNRSAAEREDLRYVVRTLVRTSVTLAAEVCRVPRRNAVVGILGQKLVMRANFNSVTRTSCRQLCTKLSALQQNCNIVGSCFSAMCRRPI